MVSPLASPTGVTGASPSAAVTSSPAGTASAAVSTASPGATATAAGAATATAAGAATASPGGGTATSSSDPCTVASRADVEAVIGTLTTTPTKVSLPLVGFSVSACVFASNEGTLTAAIGPRNLSKDSFDVAMRTVPDLTAVSGVGDSAYAVRLDAPTGMAGAAGIVATKSGVYFTVQAAHKTKTSSTLMTGVTDIAKKAAGLF
jgi:hypothetical protein